MGTDFLDGDGPAFSEVDAPEDLADCSFQEWACIHCGVEFGPYEGDVG